MSLPPNRVKTNRVWHVKHRRFSSQEWYILAKDAEEAKCVVLSENERLKHEDLTAEATPADPRPRYPEDDE